MMVGPVKAGDVLADKYRVERVLGQGGMGLIVAATHIELDEKVAIKFLIGVPSEASAKRFLTEAKAAAKIRNEHVCRTFDFGRTASGEPYIVMEYLEGNDLGAELATRGPLPAAEVAEWSLQACKALATAHALGIVHRDIKPENLFLCAAHGRAPRTLKVLDFGVSKMPDSSVTKSAIAMGSPLYMAPEQMASSRDVDARADVWSLGATMYELLSGRPPFDAPNVLALAALLRETEAEPLSRVRPDLPAELCAIVMRCLTKDPSLRFASGAEVGAALTGDSATFARHVEPFVSTRIMSSNPDFGASADGLQKTQRAPSNVASAAGTAPEPTEAPRERRSFRGPFGALAVGGVVLGVALFVGWRFEKTDSRSPVTASASASAPEPAVPTVAIRKTDSPDSPVASVETPIPSSTPAPPKTPPSAVVHGPSARPAASSHAPSKPSAPVPILPPRL